MKIEKRLQTTSQFAREVFRAHEWSQHARLWNMRWLAVHSCRLFYFYNETTQIGPAVMQAGKSLAPRRPAFPVRRQISNIDRQDLCAAYQLFSTVREQLDQTTALRKIRVQPDPLDANRSAVRDTIASIRPVFDPSGAPHPYPFEARPWVRQLLGWPRLPIRRIGPDGFSVDPTLLQDRFRIRIVQQTAIRCISWYPRVWSLRVRCAPQRQVLVPQLIGYLNADQTTTRRYDRDSE